MIIEMWILINSQKVKKDLEFELRVRTLVALDGGTDMKGFMMLKKHSLSAR